MNMRNWIGLDDSHLTHLSTEHALHKACVDDFFALQNAAALDGVDLQLCSSYRSFERQVSIWNRKWQGQLAILDGDSQKLDPDSLTDSEKLHAILRWSALPGASRHHWGTDMDVYDKANVDRLSHRFELVPDEYQAGGPCATLSDWMASHLASFGFYQPYAVDTGGIAVEPWHISHIELSGIILDEFHPDALITHLANSKVEGFATIEAEFDVIIERYFRNKGTVR